MQQPAQTPLSESLDFHELKGRVGSIEQVVQRIDAAVSSIALSLQTLARLEERHSEVRTSLDTAWEKIDKHDDEVTAIQLQLATELPPLKETRGWVIMGVLAGLGTLLAALIALVVHAPK